MLISNPSLETLLAQDLTNKEAWLIYSDWLQMQHDSRGELIALKYRLEENSLEEERMSIKNRMNTIKYGNYTKWLGKELTAFLKSTKIEITEYIPPPSNNLLSKTTERFSKWLDKDLPKTKLGDIIKCKWICGFITEAVFYSQPLTQDKIGVLLRILRSPAGILLNKLTISDIDYAEGILQKIAKGKPHTNLRQLYVVEKNQYRKETNFYSLERAFPHLEYFSLQATINPVIPLALHHTRLERLVVHGIYQIEGAIVWQKLKLPALRKLQLHFQPYSSQEPSSEYNFLNPLLEQGLFPNLTYLNIKHIDLNKKFMVKLAESKLLSNLKELNLSQNYLSDRQLSYLIEIIEYFQHLEVLNLGANFSLPAQDKLRALFKTTHLRFDH